MGLDFDDGIKIINKSLDKQAEDRAFKLYAARYPWMGEEDFVPFHKFYNPEIQSQVEYKTEAEILAEVKQTLDSFKGGDRH